MKYGAVEPRAPHYSKAAIYLRNPKDSWVLVTVSDLGPGQPIKGFFQFGLEEGSIAVKHNGPVVHIAATQDARLRIIRDAEISVRVFANSPVVVEN